MALQVQQIPVEQPQRRRFTVDEYYRMADTGILKSNDRVQLVDGEIIEMPPIGPEHASTVDAVGDVIRRLLGDTVVVRGQNPVRMGDHSEPEPDLAIVRRWPGVE